MDPHTTMERADDEARFFSRHQWGCAALFVALVFGLLWAAFRSPLVHIMAGVVLALFVIEPLTRDGRVLWLWRSVQAIITHRRPVPRMGFVSLSGPRIPWRLIVLAGVVAVAGFGVWRIGAALDDAHARAAAAEVALEAARAEAVSARQDAALAREALILADRTERAEEASDVIVREAVAVIRAPRRTPPEPAINPPNPPPHSEPVHASEPDPVPVWADAVGRLLDDASGLTPAAA